MPNETASFGGGGSARPRHLAAAQTETVCPLYQAHRLKFELHGSDTFAVFIDNDSEDDNDAGNHLPHEIA